MKSKMSVLKLPFFAFQPIFVSLVGMAGMMSGSSPVMANELKTTEIIFKGPEAKMSLNLFKFQLKNHNSDVQLNLKFIPTEREVPFPINLSKMKHKQLVARLAKAVKTQNNCNVIKENQPDQIMAEVEYRSCHARAVSLRTMEALNSKPNMSWEKRILAEQKVTLARAEMSLEAVNIDGDTVAFLTDLAKQVEDEVNYLSYRHSGPQVSEISVVPNFSGSVF